MKKLVTFGLLGGLIMLAVGMLTTLLFHTLAPSLETEFENTALFRTASDPLMLLYFVHPFFFGLVLAWIWSKTKFIFQGDSDLKRGISFGMTIWFAFSLPGMLISYASFPISPLMIISWTISTLVQLCCLGILFSRVLK